MKATCDQCGITLYSTLDKLIELGWVSCTIIDPIKRTFTRCPKHRGTIKKDIVDALGGGTGDILDENMLSTIECGVIGDYKW